MTQAVFDQPVEVPVDSVVSAEDLNLPVDQADKHLPTEVHLGRQSYIRVKLWKL